MRRIKISQDDLFGKVTSTDQSYLFDRVTTFVPNNEKIYLKVKNMTYAEFMSFRADLIRTQRKLSGEACSDEAGSKFWERLIRRIEKDHSFTRPHSDSTEAIRKRRERG